MEPFDPFGTGRDVATPLERGGERMMFRERLYLAMARLQDEINLVHAERGIKVNTMEWSAEVLAAHEKMVRRLHAEHAAEDGYAFAGADAQMVRETGLRVHRAIPARSLLYVAGPTARIIDLDANGVQIEVEFEHRQFRP